MILGFAFAEPTKLFTFVYNIIWENKKKITSYILNVIYLAIDLDVYRFLYS
jgi:hypothetical protein